MKIQLTRMVTEEIDIAAVRVVAPVRYDEEDMPNDYPHRKDDTWDVTINIDSGQIGDWPKGTAGRDLHMKVVDTGSYYLVDRDGEVVAKKEQEYVPDFFPSDHYGDYLIFNINDDGEITNWDVDAIDVAKAFNFAPVDN